MSVFRVEKTKNYTVMANYHFREREMSLKAKGLLSFMLSLPDDWDYSVAGLVSICKENETAIKSTLKELQEFGYLEIIKNLPTVENKGRISYDYIVYEKPIQEHKKQGVENLGVEFQGVENQAQINTNKQNTKKQSIKRNISNINITNIRKTPKPDNPFSRLEQKEEKAKNKKPLTERQLNAIKLNKVLNDFVNEKRIDEEIEVLLKKYLKVRKMKTLIPEQLELILDNYYQDFNDKPIELQKQQINKAIARGWTELTFADNFSGNIKSSYSSKPTFDNTANHNVPKAFAEMSEDEKINFYKNELARDENGNLMKF